MPDKLSQDDLTKIQDDLNHRQATAKKGIGIMSKKRWQNIKNFKTKYVSVEVIEHAPYLSEVETEAGSIYIVKTENIFPVPPADLLDTRGEK